MKLQLLVISVLIALTAVSARAETAPEKASYFVSIKADEANVRTGPNVRYPIKWLYKKENWPVEVVAVFEGWRKIKDIDGDEGWIHESLLTRRRNVIIKSEEAREVLNTPNEPKDITFMVENGVLAALERCKANWCKINTDGYEGWIEAKYLYGVYDGETVD